MSQGFVIDRTHGGSAVPSWVEGAPQRSVWTGLKLGDEPRFEIAAWRCGRCGFLEQYASGTPSRYDQRRKQVALVIVLLAIAVAMIASAVAAILSS